MAVIAPRGRAGTRATGSNKGFCQLGVGCHRSSGCGGGGGGALRSQPPSPLPLPPLLAGGAAPLLSLGVGVRKGENPGMKRAGAKGVVVRTCGRSGGSGVGGAGES